MFKTSSENASKRPAGPKRQLTLFDSTSIIVGVIIGAGIYETSPAVAGCLPGPGWLIALWVFGGLLSLIGALCYAELATAYPEAGGDYVYLTRAFGRSMGFLFAWAQLWVVRPGSIGAFAYVFARYANQLWPLPSGADAPMLYAAGSIVGLTAINIVGVREGKWTQNLLTVAKVLGLAAVCLVGLLFASPNAAPAAPLKELAGADFRLAMIFILFTYGGWNEMAYVGAEVRDPKKNILRALVSGTVMVTVVYVLVNLAFIHALGYQAMCQSGAVATDVLTRPLGQWGGRVISLLICISALGAINGMIFAGSRIYYAMGTDHRLYARLGQWNARLGTPVWSLVFQCLITLALVVGFGIYEGGFGSLVNFTTPVFWIFFLLVGVSLFVLRWREPDTPRPYRVLLYPWIPIVFVLSSLFMVYASLSWAVDNSSYEAMWAIGILLVGFILSFFDPADKPQGG